MGCWPSSSNCLALKAAFRKTLLGRLPRDLLNLMLLGTLSAVAFRFWLVSGIGSARVCSKSSRKSTINPRLATEAGLEPSSLLGRFLARLILPTLLNDLPKPSSLRNPCTQTAFPRMLRVLWDDSAADCTLIIRTTCATKLIGETFGPGFSV